jgi:hypothetical protein
MKTTAQETWDARCRALTLSEAWPVVTRAWLERRQNLNWRVIANSVNYARHDQHNSKTKRRGGKRGNTGKTEVTLGGDPR